VGLVVAIGGFGDCVGAVDKILPTFPFQFGYILFQSVLVRFRVWSLPCLWMVGGKGRVGTFLLLFTCLSGRVESIYDKHGPDRKSGGVGKSGKIYLNLGWWRVIKKKKK
jgi:uncharacterized membrane protein